MARKIRPDKAQYLAGDTIRIVMTECDLIPSVADVKVFCLHERILADIQISPEMGHCDIIVKNLIIGHYGIEIDLKDEILRTSFDIANQARDVVRYGFLSDFSLCDAKKDISFIRDMHLNAVQFYDWMFRHDDLISQTKSYDDPLGRPTDLESIRNKIDYCTNIGARPFAYGAVYAAGHALFNANPEWGLYSIDGDPLVFDSWLHFMNIKADSRWCDHIIGQFEKAISVLGFKGIHMDTYGYPKIVTDAQGQTFSLSKAFPELIDRAYEAVHALGEDHGVIFNAVNNWPVENVATARQDAIYIEVWPPHETYFDLYRLIREAKYFGHKHVILAAYMHPFKHATSDTEIKRAEQSLLLAQAVINASGGTQLVFGENEGVLCDSYYVNHKTLSKPFVNEVIRVQDHLVRYADLLYNDHGVDVSMTSSGGINDDIRFEAGGVTFSPDGKPDTIWTIIRESDERLTIQMINLLGNDGKWNAPKDMVGVVNDIQVTLRFDRKVKGIYMATPDDDGKLHALTWTMTRNKQGRHYRFTLHELKVWNTIWVETES